MEMEIETVVILLEFICTAFRNERATGTAGTYFFDPHSVQDE
jgi:hypothetical protein